MGFPARSDTNRPVQSQSKLEAENFGFKKKRELYFPSSENKGADQLHGYREADLHLCFCIMQIVGFTMRRLKCGMMVFKIHLFSLVLVFSDSPLLLLFYFMMMLDSILAKYAVSSLLTGCVILLDPSPVGPIDWRNCCCITIPLFGLLF